MMTLFDITSLNNWLTLRAIALYIISTIALYHVIRKIRKFYLQYQAIERLPGPKITYNVLLGNLYVFTGNNHADILTRFFNAINGLIQVYQQYSFFRLWASYQPTVFVYKAKAAEKVLSSTVNIEKSFVYAFIKHVVGTGLVVSDGGKWITRRKMLTPAFHFNILEEFLGPMNEQAGVLVKIIKNLNAERCEPLDSVSLFTKCTIDIICETAMGVKIGSQDNDKCSFADSINRLTMNVIKRALRPWLWNNFIYQTFSSQGQSDEKDIKYVHEFTTKIIKERKKDYIQNRGQESVSQQKATVSDDLGWRKKRLAFIDILIEQHLAQPTQFTELDLREEVETFMVAGYETTAMSLIWTLYLLGTYPEIQDRVHAEIVSCFQDDQQGWSMAQLRKFKFLEACIKESLRLFPSVPIIGRKSTEDIQTEDGTIPKDTAIFLFLYGIQRDPQYFPKPNHFQPDRFIDHATTKTNPFAFVPFSAGPRNCIGQRFALQEEKVVLATVLRHFRVESTQPLESVLIQSEMILRPKIPVLLRFVARGD